MPLGASKSVFAPDTPSRVLRHIERLNQQALPDLPGLPSEAPSFSEDDDSTVAGSPVRKQAYLPPPVSPPPAQENLPPPTPYSSTPAPSFYQRSPSANHPPTSGSYRSANDTTATIGPGGRFSSVRRGGRTPTRAMNGAVTEGETSYERSVSEIVKARSLDDEREDMLVFSGGSGTEAEDPAPQSFRVKQTKSVELSALPSVQFDTTEDPTTDRSDGEASRPHPLDALGGLDSYAGPPTREEPPKSPSPPPPAKNTSHILPESLSPLRTHETTAPSVASPELGRHSSPHDSPHHQHSFSRDATPSRFASQSPSTSRTPFGAKTPKFDSPLASLDLNANPTTPAVNQDAVERRKAHLLGTLRSTAKHTLVRGTPHPLRSARRTSPRPADGAEDADHTSSSFGSDRSSNDLTTFHKANTSLPSGGSADIGGSASAARASRFNGAKLNAYLHSLNTHLTEENQSLAKAVSRVTKDYERIEAENRRLNDTVREMSMAGGITVDLSRAGPRSRTTSIEEEDEDGVERSRVEMLGEELEGLVQGQRRIRGLQDQLGDDARVQELEESLEQLQRQLADKDDEVHRLRNQVARSFAAADDSDAGPASADLAVQQARVAELVAELEEKDGELDAVKRQMEEQETEFADKMKELEDELCKVLEEQEAKVDRAREELDAKRREDDELRAEEREKLARVEAERDELERQLLDNSTDVGAEVEEKLHGLRDEVARLEDEVKTLRDDIATRDEALEQMQQELDEAEERVVTGATSELDDLRAQLADRDSKLQQLDEAFEDSAQQLVQHEETIEALQKQLDAEQKKSAALTAQMSTLSLPKTKSPLANEVYNEAKDEAIASLEEELDVSRKTVDELREKLAEAERASRDVELQAVEIKKLKEDKISLEVRIKSLREQSVLFSPSKTPDKSWVLRPLPSVLTPKTPGAFLKDLSFRSSGSAANETITPDLMHIAELQQVVENLRVQINDAYDQVDDKLGKLDSAGTSNLALARQLAAAEVRIAHLEDQLDALVGDGGSLQRVKARLAKVHCPECQTAFDANKSVQLRIDGHGVTVNDSTPHKPRPESLRITLAEAKGKIKELQVANESLQNQAARSSELAEEKTRLQEHSEGLQRDLVQARDELAVLETDLRTERSRLRTLTTEQSQAAKRATAAEAVRPPLHLLFISHSLIRPSPQTANQHLADVQSLRDERATILRGVADLQAELKRFHEDATRHGQDVAAAKRDGIELSLVREELELAKRKVGMLEKQIDEHVCSGADPSTIAALEQQHKLEVRGAMKRILQLQREVGREFFFRTELGAQKDYLKGVVGEKQATIDSIMRDFSALLGTSPSSSSSKPTKSRPTLRSAALAVIALARMKRLAAAYAPEKALKKQFRERDYPRTRGKAFPAQS
ncbi:hypothetical protein JCM8097_002531 [Rhodosporidiobolus ruineniae]